MDRAAVAQVPDEAYGQVIDISPETVFYGVEVQESLGGVLADAVAGVDDRCRAVHGCSQRVGGRGGFASRAAIGVPQYNGVGIASNGLDRVMQALALRDRRVLHAARGGDDPAAQPLSRRLEGEVGASRWLVERVGDDAVSEQWLDLAHGHLA